MDWQIGCSGFHYKEWRGVFYPQKLPQRLWFDHYCKSFHCLELNVTFYRFPQVKYLLNWYGISPPHFKFAVKVPRLISHYKQFNDCERMLGDFYRSIREGLKDKLGPVLTQLSPRTKYSIETLERVVRSLDHSFNNVIEFRTADWWNKTTMKLLKENNLSFCGISHPGLPEDVMSTSPLLYYRFHGIEKRYFSSYSKETLRKVYAAIKKKRKIKEAYVFFNNTASLAAIENALDFRAMVNRQ